MFHVYILYAPNYDKYYIGQTQDIVTRLAYHNELNDESYTSKYRPWELEKSWCVKTRKEAMKLERFIKKQKSQKFIKKLINDPIVFISLCSKLEIEVL